jgi:hypothetical protein
MVRPMLMAVPVEYPAGPTYGQVTFLRAKLLASPGECHHDECHRPFLASLTVSHG